MCPRPPARRRRLPALRHWLGWALLCAVLAAGPATPPDTSTVRTQQHQAQELMRAGRFDAAQPLLQQSRQLAHRLGFRAGEAEALRLLARAELVHGSFGRARALLTEGIALARSTPSQPRLADLLLTLGQAANEQDDYPGALRACEEALRLFHAQGNLLQETRTRNGLGIIYSSHNDFPRALAALLPALRQARQLHDRGLEANCLINLGGVYFRHEQFWQARHYFGLALPLLRGQAAERNALADCLTNLAAAYQQLGQRAQAVPYYREAIAVSEKAGEQAQLGQLLGNYGELLRTLHRLPEARSTLEHALVLLEKAGDQDNLAVALVSLGELRNEQGEQAAAEALGRRALAIAERIKSYGVVESAGLLLARQRKQRGDFQQALRYTERAHAAHDTIFSLSKAEEMGRLQGDFQLSQERDRAGALARVSENQQQRLRQQQRELWGLALGLAAAALAGLGLWRLNRLLGRKNAQIEQQRTELAELNATKDRLFSIIGHDLRGPLHSLHAFVGLLSGPPLPADKLSHYARRLSHTLDHTLALLENLLHWAALQMRATAPPRPESLALAEVVAETTELLAAAAEAGQVALTHTLSGKEYVMADPAAVRLVLRNLLSNAIKFTPAGGSVRIAATRADNTWQLTVADTGRGLPVATPRQALHPETLERRAGEAGQARSTGLGLRLSSDVAARNGGQLWVESGGPGQGTAFTVAFPVAAEPSERG